MLALYGPNSPVGIHLKHTKWGVGVALLFVTLPFVVRSVQPVLLELDREVEEAAASLGANNWTIFRRVILPALLPSLLSRRGTGVLPGHRRVRLGGADRRRHPARDRGVVAVDPAADRERRPANAAAISIVLLAISFVMLFILRAVGGAGASAEELAQ